MARLLLLSLLTLSAFAQSSSVTFSYQGPSDPSPVSVVSGGTINFPLTPVGGSSSVSLFLNNRAATAYQITEGGATGSFFSGQVRNVPVSAGGTVTLIVSFSPTAAGPAAGAYSLTLTGGGQTTTYTFTLSATAGSATLATSYALASTGNQVPISTGGLINFPATILGSRSNATFVISNQGAITADIGTVTLSGKGFELANLPLLPARLAAGQELRFTLSFVPTALTTYTAALAVGLGSETRSFTLMGQGSGPSFSYAIVSSNATTAVLPEGLVPFPDTVVTTGRSSLQIKVTNDGDVAGTINSVSLSGTSFTLENTPALPLSIAPGTSALIGVAFTPRDTGSLTGRLRLDNIGFNLAGTGLGARLSLTLVVGSQRTPISGTSATVPNTSVGGRQAFDIEIANAGNAPATVSAIAFAAGSTSSPFTITRLPALPLQLAPGATTTFTATFAPTGLGLATATLQVEDLSISLRGTGTPPPALPSVLYPTLSDHLNAFDTPAASLKFDRVYPYDVNGKLTIGFVSDVFADDPAVLFASGARTVDFRIPANSTDAVFSSGATSIKFQTGTTAGSITLSATFSVSGLDLSPAGGASRSMTVDRTPPAITTIAIGTRTTSSVELLVSGYAPTRSLTNLTFDLTPATGVNLATTKLTANVDNAFTAWYQGATSRLYGTQFTFSVRFDISGNGSAIGAVQVTAANALGSSQPRTISLTSN